MEEDALLIEQFRRGSKTAFDSLVGKYRREIYFLALRMLNNAEDAEEAAQQAFVSAFNGIGGFREDSAFRTWLYRIAINQANSLLRKRPNEAELVEGSAAPEGAEARTPLDGIVAKESARDALAALGELGEKQRMVVTLRIFQELPYAEIGRLAGCSEATAKVHFHYGIENLRKRMAGHEM